MLCSRKVDGENLQSKQENRLKYSEGVVKRPICYVIASDSK